MSNCRRSWLLLAGLISLPGFAAPEIKVLSSHPALVSDGDVLLEVLGTTTGDSSLRIELDGRNVTERFTERENGRRMGLLKGLKPGTNTLHVLDDQGSRTLEIRNHPGYGPLFSAGQHRRDGWEDCRAGLQSPQKDCNVAPSYRWLYKPANPLQPGLVEFDPAGGMPDDVAMTTTDNGHTLPFVVRREDGFLDRDRYTILVLYQPEQDWQPWQPQPQWNRKLLIPHGGNCGRAYSPGEPQLSDSTGGVPGGPEHTYVYALGSGFAVLSTALNNGAHNCDMVLQAESMIMAKERLVEQYGELRYTIGTGCSNGAIAQHTVANAYPGVYQGLLTTCSYPDGWSSLVKGVDYHLLRQYLENPTRWGAGVSWSPHQFGPVEGHVSHLNAVVTTELFYDSLRPDTGCAGPDSYHPDNNPQGVRCGRMEWGTHVWGTRLVPGPAGDPPIAVSKFTYGNQGIPYGLQALRDGQISPAQFVDLNQQIGGVDHDMNLQAARTHSDPGAIASAMRSGIANPVNHLDKVAIINFFGPDPGAAHDAVHAWWTRWRLERRHGHHDNHVMWGGPGPLIGDPWYFPQSFYAMDRWLAAVEADRSDAPLAEKIVRNRPADVHDQCSNGLGQKIADALCVELLRPAYAYGTPRTAAGADRHAMNYDCQLKPFSRADDFGPLPFTEAQWQQLESLFADGVCDYALPGIAETVQTRAWLGYRDEQGEITVGGAPLPVPGDPPAGWASPAFADTAPAAMGAAGESARAAPSGSRLRGGGALSLWLLALLLITRPRRKRWARLITA